MLHLDSDAKKLASLFKADAQTPDLKAFVRNIAALIASDRGLPLAALPQPISVQTHFDWAAADPRLLGRVYTALMSQRHSQGSYYTPPTMAADVVKWTLDGLDTSSILDPAMGSGDFLIAAADYLVGIGCSPEDALWRLHGIDRDPFAVELAHITLWLWLCDPTLTHTEIPAHLHHADALLDNIPNAPFDAVIGNPPFASVFTRSNAEEPTYRDKLKDKYATARGSFDLAVPFVERAVNVCHEGGRVGFVLPNKILSADYARPLRKWLSNRASLTHFADYAAAETFTASVYPVACCLEVLEHPQPDSPLIITRNGTTHHRTQADLWDVPGDVWSAALDPDWHTLRRCFENSVPLGEIAEISAGLAVSEAYDLRPHITEATTSDIPPGHVALLTTGVVQRYESLWQTQPVRFLKQTYQQPCIPLGALSPRRQHQATQQKIILAGMGMRPRAYLDDGQAQASVATLVITESVWPLDALCALLNSNIMARLYRALYGGLALSGGYLRFGKREVSRLPIPDVLATDPRVQRLNELGIFDGEEIEATTRAVFKL